MEFQDKVLKCVDCGADFIFTAGEQLFFSDKQFKNEPKRCKACKGKRAQSMGVATQGAYPKVETRTMCSNCGKETTGSLQAYPGTTGVLPRVFSAEEGRGRLGFLIRDVAVTCGAWG